MTALRSANDVAVALAEKVGGSEARFTALMTLRAQELGMTNTRFVNAHGLPDSRQITTARDIAILSRAVMRDYPQYYSYFGQKEFEFRGTRVKNHNGLLNKMPGVDGLKTGFTNASGFNLAASAVRDGRRLIAVVLGGQSTASRDENVEDLLNAGFDVFYKRKLGQNITVAANMREPDDIDGPITRASVEQGSGEQAGLRVVVSDTPGAMAPIGEAPAWPAQPMATSGLKAATMALSDADDEPAAKQECSKVATKVKLKATKTRKARTVTRTRTVCKDARETVRVASAEEPSCDKAPVGKAAKARAAARSKAEACKAEARTASAAKKDAGGGYRIQVGAFDSRSAAQGHLSKMVKRYGPVLSTASQAVETGGAGAYRARFNGFSAQGAKAACAALAAKGERCLVLAPS